MADEPTNYIVTGQNQSTELTPAGYFHDVMQVHAQSRKHRTHHSISVPMSEYHPHKVHQLLTERIANADAVSDLGH